MRQIRVTSTEQAIQRFMDCCNHPANKSKIQHAMLQPSNHIWRLEDTFGWVAISGIQLSIAGLCKPDESAGCNEHTFVNTLSRQQFDRLENCFFGNFEEPEPTTPAEISMIKNINSYTWMMFLLFIVCATMIIKMAIINHDNRIILITVILFLIFLAYVCIDNKNKRKKRV